MQALATSRRFRNLVTIVPVLFLAAACGQGDGPESIANTPATPLPPTAPGFCDAINFELECSDPGIVNFNGGATIIVDNPDPSGINTSDRVARMQKFPDEVFGGTLLNLGDPIDFSEGESYTVKIWSPRPVAVSFKLEEQGNPAGGLTVDEDHSGSGSWEELCFDFTGQAVPTPVVALTIIFDNGTLGQADTDPDNWTFYYDDITQVESCEAAGGPGEIQPDAALYTSGAAPDLAIPGDYAERTAFGSGSVIDPDYADDETFSPALSVFSGTGYGANVAQVGFIGFSEGFLTRYASVDFKVKGMPGFVIFVKLFDGVDALRLNLTSSAYASELSDGWFQVSIPVEDFADADQATGIVLESDDSAQTAFRMLLNDVGFSGTGTFVPAAPGIVPEVALYDRDGTADLLIPDDYAQITVFGSGAIIDDNFNGDLDFSPALAVTTGFGYGIWNGQLAYTGFAPGFAATYETLDFKAKGLNNDLIRVRFLDGGDYLDIVLSGSALSTDLGNGWYQVSIPLASFTGVDTATGLLFETDGAASSAFTFLLTDIGFSGETGPADSPDSIIPENVIFATDPAVAADFEFGVDYTGFEPFGSGSVFNSTFADDPDFSPVFAVTSGAGYGANVGQFAIVGFDAGFASGFATLDFKVKGMPGDLIRVKFLDNGDYVDIDLTTSEYSTALGNGWYQVSIPLTQFTGVDTATALLFESNNTSPDQFTFLLTDFGFSGVASGGGGAGAGIIPDNVVYATDPGVTEDLAPPAVDNFGSGAVFDFNFAGDPDFNPALQVTSGEGYGAGVHVGFVAFNGYAAGFAAGFENFVFKVKGDAGNLAAFEVKFINNGDTSQTYNLATYSGVTDLGNGWLQVSIPMSDFAATIAGNSGFLLGPLGGQAAPFTLLLTDIGFTGTAGGGGGGGGATGELAINGDFETGDLSGWETSPNGGTITTTADSAAGAFAANLNITAAGNPTLKAANLGAGELTPGQQVTVSFDWKGSDANGGVVDIRLFSELSGGGVSATEIIREGAGFPADWTTIGPLTITTGPDVSGGVTLQFTAICGAVAGCVSDVYIDNVSIVAN